MAAERNDGDDLLIDLLGPSTATTSTSERGASTAAAVLIPEKASSLENKIGSSSSNSNSVESGVKSSKNTDLEEIMRLVGDPFVPTTTTITMNNSNMTNNISDDSSNIEDGKKEEAGEKEEEKVVASMNSSNIVHNSDNNKQEKEEVEKITPSKQDNPSVNNNGNNNNGNKSNSGSPTKSSNSNTSASDTPPNTPPKFNYQKFLEKWRTSEASPVQIPMRKFIKDFQTRRLNVSQQTEEIQHFLQNLFGQVSTDPYWNSNPVNLDFTFEGLEKFLMTRIYDQVYAPPSSDDALRDQVLHHRLRLFTWVKEKHLDIPSVPLLDETIISAGEELHRMNKFKAPRDKFICLLNCCKILYRLVRKSDVDKGADSIIPLLIYTVICNNPPNLISNLLYIERYRNPNKLREEAFYYFTSVMGAISFIETMDASSFTITPEEFDENISEALKQMEMEDQEEEERKKREAQVEEKLKKNEAIASPQSPNGETVPASEPKNFEDKLSEEERVLLQDEELQLALAMSISELQMQKERKQ